VRACSGTVVVHGTGAALVTAGDLLVYADLARWEVQQRQRAGELPNLGADNAGERRVAALQARVLPRLARR
jgi:mannose-6-phosphate isomerase